MTNYTPYTLLDQTAGPTTIETSGGSATISAFPLWGVPYGTDASHLGFYKTYQAC